MKTSSLGSFVMRTLSFVAVMSICASLMAYEGPHANDLASMLHYLVDWQHIGLATLVGLPAAYGLWRLLRPQPQAAPEKVS
jgi:hypothetical protein